MNNFEIISATHPRHQETDTETITLDVRFAHLSDPVPFTARKDDPEAHGRELYSRAVFGEFGSIELIPTLPPTETEQLARLSNEMKRATLAMAPLEDADKLGIINEAERVQLTAWQQYRVMLSRLPQNNGWPASVTWPELPQ
ncbi:tail fiber assembly protein [Aeromonas sanarellii]|uniref:tail fiber assembly protein n=1 Tax=Aeromonas sanarellii TaxID=633415 RepID=UPI0039A1F171